MYPLFFVEISFEKIFSIFVLLFLPGFSSTPLLISKALGFTASMPLKMFLSFSPPASMIGSLIWSNSTEDQSNVFPVPPTRFLSYASSSNAETLYELKIDLFKLGFNGIALITGISMNSAVGEVLSADISWESNGAPTEVSI